MPEKKTIERARRAKREGKAPTTQAGAFVGEEIEHVRRGKHGARSAKQAIAIGLSKARRAGIALPPPPGGGRRRGRTSSSKTAATKSPRRSRAVTKALRREPKSSASRTALSKQAKRAARTRRRRKAA